MIKFTRDGVVWAVLAAGGFSGFVLEHYDLLQRAFPFITPAWHARIELISTLAGFFGAYLRLSPLPLSSTHPLATNQASVTLSPLDSKKPL